MHFIPCFKRRAPSSWDQKSGLDLTRNSRRSSGALGAAAGMSMCGSRYIGIVSIHWIPGMGTSGGAPPVDTYAVGRGPEFNTL